MEVALMTVAIGIAVPEGIVIAGDSRSSFSVRQIPKIASDYSEKVYIIERTQTGVATYGWARLLKKNLHSHINDFSLTLDDNTTNSEQTVNKIADYFESKYNEHIAQGLDAPVAQGAIALGFIIGGYNDSVGSVYSCNIPGKVIQKCCDTSSPGAAWNGQIDVISRLIMGYDPRLDLTQFTPEQTDLIKKNQYITYFDAMNLQDAIDYAILLVRTTIDMQRFSDGTLSSPGGVQGVGGFIDVLVVRKGEAKWIQKKELRGEVPSWDQSIY
jgi:hypothetical protein